MRVVAGIDIGGTNTKFGLVDENGVCKRVNWVNTKKFREPEIFVKEVASEIRSLLPPDYELIGIGIGVANGNFHKGTIESAPNLPWHGAVPLTKLFKKEINVPCVLTNDANAAAIGEMLFGGAKEMNDFIFITLGTGLGSGIVVNGQVVYGHDGLAAELGHVMVAKNGRACRCGRKGCLETYVSATGIMKTIYSWIGQGKKTILTRVNGPIQASDIYMAARQGDSLALEAFEYTGEILGHALANSVAYTSPKAIFLFGGLANAKDLLFDPTIRHFEKNLFAIYKNKIKILPSKLKENKVAILGAASLIWSKN
ncbi:MAG: ROK family protein [Bacteroidota bacterium]